MVIYYNEFETKENKIQTKNEKKLKHNIYNKNKLISPFTDLICLLQILSSAFTCVC